MSDQPTPPEAQQTPPQPQPSSPPPPPAAYEPPAPGAPPPMVQQPPVLPQKGMSAGAGTAGVISQFTGAAGWGVLLGIVTIVVPFVFNRVFFFLPIIGLIAGIQALRTGKLIGGIVAIVLNVIGGIITLIGMFG